MPFIKTNHHILLENIPKEGCNLFFDDLVFLSADNEDVGNLWEEGMRLEGPVKISLQFTREAEDIYVTGHMEFLASLECQRCLQRYVQPLVSDFVYLLVRTPGEELSDTQNTDESITIVLAGDEVPLGDMLYEQILLSVPMSHLCRETCKGLCPQCGEDLNQHTCSCSKERVTLFAGIAPRKSN
ncbi:MAG: DUF177 domain-containing protein [Dissulfuribacterales bacterium]